MLSGFQTQKTIISALKPYSFTVFVNKKRKNRAFYLEKFQIEN